jgi:acetolactate synthase-1/2/3 large subunit
MRTIYFNKPDLVMHTRSHGARYYRVEAADQRVPVLQQAIADDTVAVDDCPMDCSECMKVGGMPGNLVSSI